MMEKISLTIILNLEKISITAEIIYNIMYLMKRNYEVKLKFRGIQKKSSNATF